MGDNVGMSPQDLGPGKGRQPLYLGVIRVFLACERLSDDWLAEFSDASRA
jgi:hypothetical protein